MTKYSIEALGYNWLDVNPSDEQPLPVILGKIFNPNGQLAWAADPTVESAEMLLCAQEQLDREYPALFLEAQAMAVMYSNEESFYEAEKTISNYRAGITLAVLAVEFSLPQEKITDLSSYYASRFEDLDLIDKEDWLRRINAESVANARQLYGFIYGVYSDNWELDEMEKRAVLYGARSAFVLMAHARACKNREQEESWREHLSGSTPEF